ncbi:hypothetical protein [Embleya sp. NBC_00896]|uniref:hypothetical protein n=1 Tax=Embleya sp. NBC_00896 TaxID=2975961 RepID=UPI002F912C97|nr:hypothetical protein OG928_33315 [Embleya sp. NBC_00896]
MLKLLWHGHRERHPGGATSAPVTEKTAQGATHLAALLVRWFATGIVRHKP